jgi:hypothetical protein
VSIGLDQRADRRGFHPEACERLAELLEQLAGNNPSPRRFIVALGRDGAGIRPGFIGVVDLLRGGKDIIVGRGFRRHYADATTGQVRHFAGTATATARFGPRLTRWLSEHVRNDPVASADGRLTDAGIDFARELLDRRLEVTEAAGWIRRNLCNGSDQPKGEGCDDKPAEQQTPEWLAAKETPKFRRVHPRAPRESD